jgi:hypothetical protein
LENKHLWIPYDEISFGDIIGSGSSCKVYKGFLRGTEIGIHTFLLINYSNKKFYDLSVGL